MDPELFFSLLLYLFSLAESLEDVLHCAMWQQFPVRIVNPPHIESNIVGIGDDVLSSISNLWYENSCGFYFFGSNQSYFTKFVNPSGWTAKHFEFYFVDRKHFVCPKKHVTINQTSVLFLDMQHNYLRHYGHVMEHFMGAVIALLSSGGNFSDVKNIIFCYPVTILNNRGRNFSDTISIYIIKKLFYNANIYYGDTFKSSFASESPMLLSKVIVTDRSAATNPLYHKIFRMLSGQMSRKPNLWPLAIEELTKRLSINISHVLKQITIVLRDDTRNVSLKMHTRLFSLLNSTFGKDYKIEAIDFGKLSNDQQLMISMNTIAMIGVHGNGLTNLLWMPTNSCIIEILPPGIIQKDFPSFAHLASHRYTAIRSETGDVWPNSVFEAVEDANVSASIRAAAAANRYKPGSGRVPDFDWKPAIEWMKVNCCPRAVK